MYAVLDATLLPSPGQFRFVNKRRALSTVCRCPPRQTRAVARRADRERMSGIPGHRSATAAVSFDVYGWNGKDLGEWRHQQARKNLTGDAVSVTLFKYVDT